MAPFSQNDRDENSLDYCILRDGGISLYRSSDFMVEDMNWLINDKYQLYSFDCQRWTSDDAMHADWQSVLSFPDYYGRNINALNDCLSDLPVPDVGGIAVAPFRYLLPRRRSLRDAIGSHRGLRSFSTFSLALPDVSF